MKQGVMPYLAPRDLTTYLGFFFWFWVGLYPADKWKEGGMEMNILKEGGFVTHLRNLAILECLSRSACTRAMKH